MARRFARNNNVFRYGVLCLFLTILANDAHADWAVAFGTRGRTAWGAGWNPGTSSSNEAQMGAMSTCRKKIGKCRMLGAGGSGCVALAVTPRSNGYGFAVRNSLVGAASAALALCTNSNPAGCKVIANFCDTSRGFKPGSVDPSDTMALQNARLRQRNIANQRRRQNQDVFNSVMGGIVNGIQRQQNQPRYSNPPPRRRNNQTNPNLCVEGPGLGSCAVQ